MGENIIEAQCRSFRFLKKIFAIPFRKVWIGHHLLMEIYCFFKTKARIVSKGLPVYLRIFRHAAHHDSDRSLRVPKNIGKYHLCLAARDCLKIDVYFLARTVEPTGSVRPNPLISIRRFLSFAK